MEVLILAVYMLPAILYCIYAPEGPTMKLLFTLCNLFLGWTVIGWIIFLVMAYEQLPGEG